MDPTAPGAEGSRGLAAEDYVTVELSDGEAPLFDAEPPSAASAPGEGLTWLAEEEVTTIELNRAALVRLRCEKKLAIVRGATHLFEEPGALDAVARFARTWFERHLVSAVEEEAIRD